MLEAQVLNPIARILIAIAKPEVTARHVQPPIEALTCAAVLRDLNFEVAIYDDRVDTEFPRGNFELIAVLTQTYDRSQCYSLQLDSARELVARLQLEFADAPMVGCGVHADIEPAFTSSALGGLATLPGELEASLTWLCTAVFVEGNPFEDLNMREAPTQVDPDALPIPAFDLIDFEHYRSEIYDPQNRMVIFGKAGLIFANRGCPYTCSYCFVWFGRKLRKRAPEKVVEDIRQLKESSVDHFFFLDYTFTFDREWTEALCTMLIDAQIDISWVCQTRCENVDLELLQLMRQAGCVGVYYGIEVPWVAEAGVRKRTKRAMIDEAIGSTEKAGLHPFVFVLLGLETQQPSRQEELIDWLRSVPATFSARPLLPRPHTELFVRSRSDVEPESWADLENESIRIGQEHWPLELESFRDRLRELPNNILNAPERSD